MEGPGLAFKVMLLLAIFMAIYRRFEKVHAKFPDFERFIRTYPVLIAIRSRDAESIAARIRQTERMFAGTGLRPWPFYSLQLAVEVSAGVVTIRPRDCALLRVEGEDPPQLLSVVRDAVTGVDAEVWVRGEIWVDLENATRSELGWYLSESDALTPCGEIPSWVQPRSSMREAPQGLATACTTRGTHAS